MKIKDMLITIWAVWTIWTWVYKYNELSTRIGAEYHKIMNSKDKKWDIWLEKTENRWKFRLFKIRQRWILFNWSWLN